MTDTMTVHDDAPLTTSKDTDVLEQTKQLIPDAQGSVVSGRTTTINRPRAELFAFWREFSNLATFMENAVRIDVLDRTRSHWVVKAPGGNTVEWDAIVTDEAEGQYIAWSSTEGADVANSGRVDFKDAQAGRGTEVTLTIVYDPPGGTIGKIIAKMFQREPAIQARRDLRRFKQLMETGEIAVAAWTRAQFEKERD